MALPSLGPTPSSTTVTVRDRRDPAYQAFLLLRTLFTVAPIVFGLDKFTNLLTDWDELPGPVVDHLVPGTGAAGDVRGRGGRDPRRACWWRSAPRFGGWLVAAWLAGIIVNLLPGPGYYDVALRDFGLLVAAVALARLAPVWLRPSTVTVASSLTAVRSDRHRSRVDGDLRPRAAVADLLRALGLDPDDDRTSPTPRGGWPRRTPSCSRRDRST